MIIAQVLCDYFAPEAMDSVEAGAGRFLHFKRTGRTVDEYPVRFDLLRRTAESRMQMGVSSPETFVPTSRTQSASLPRADKSLLLASAQEHLGMAARAKQMRRFFDPSVKAVR